MISDDATSTAIGTSGNSRGKVIGATRSMRAATPLREARSPGKPAFDAIMAGSKAS
jgi:hypothetical protein